MRFCRIFLKYEHVSGKGFYKKPQKTRFHEKMTTAIKVNKRGFDVKKDYVSMSIRIFNRNLFLWYYNYLLRHGKNLQNSTKALIN